MKSIRTTIILLALLAYGSVYSQSSADFSALTTFLPGEKLAALQENQSKYAEFAYLNSNGYYVGNTGEKDVSIYPDLSGIEALYPNLPDLTATLIESGELNLLGYSFPLSNEKYTYYRIGSSNRLLVIPPISLSLKKLNTVTD